MQPKMQKYQMNELAITALLERAATGVLVTNGADGVPYGVPVQFMYFNGNVYVHGRAAGEKLDNILRDGRVCFTVYEAQGLSYEEDGPYACGVNTLFESVVIKGRAALVADEAEKRRILYALTEKYVPSFAKKEMPEASVARTAVIEITPDSVTGKFFPGRGK